MATPEQVYSADMTEPYTKSAASGVARLVAAYSSPPLQAVASVMVTGSSPPLQQLLRAE